MKKILHPTDFSENASKALAFALGLSRKFDAQLVILHVADFPTIMNSSSSAATLPDMEEEKKAVIIQHLKNSASVQLKHNGGAEGIQFEAKLSSSTVKGIIEAINETGADLVVIGTKGESKLKEIIMGSTAKGLVAKAPCPVLLIPENARFREINKIVYASDFDQHDIPALGKLTAFAEACKASISVLHIFSNEADKATETPVFEGRLNENLKYDQLKYESVVSDNIAGSLNSYIQVNHADLLVMFEKENAGLMNRLFHKDMVKQFATHTTTPLMCLNKFSVQLLKEAF